MANEVWQLFPHGRAGCCLTLDGTWQRVYVPQADPSKLLRLQQRYPPDHPLMLLLEQMLPPPGSSRPEIFAAWHRRRATARKLYEQQAAADLGELASEADSDVESLLEVSAGSEEEEEDQPAAGAGFDEEPLPEVSDGSEGQQEEQPAAGAGFDEEMMEGSEGQQEEPPAVSPHAGQKRRAAGSLAVSPAPERGAAATAAQPPKSKKALHMGATATPAAQPAEGAAGLTPPTLHMEAAPAEPSPEGSNEAAREGMAAELLPQSQPPAAGAQPQPAGEAAAAPGQAAAQEPGSLPQWTASVAQTLHPVIRFPGQDLELSLADVSGKQGSGGALQLLAELMPVALKPAIHGDAAAEEARQTRVIRLFLAAAHQVPHQDD